MTVTFAVNLGKGVTAISAGVKSAAVSERPLADVPGLRDAAAMTFFRRAQLYGIVFALALLGYFIVPFALELAGTPCSLWSFAPDGCEVGVRGILRGAAFYCMLAGYLLSRLLDRAPLVSRQLAAIVAASAVILSGLTLWLVLHAAFS